VPVDRSVAAIGYVDRILKLIRKITGARVSDIHGKPLALNPEDNTFMNHCGVLYCSDQVIAERMIGVIGSWWKDVRDEQLQYARKGFNVDKDKAVLPIIVL
jgi:hypothetical protein